ncbi:DUF6265 family protein [Pseudoalteromonas luteoviolacea]|uniref:DUF6265 domain-containing protein n=1 Tax=Pseudoalteromonas luteoviolacea S4054 TaxID=1129367 RepID=A0A0F6ADW1_9GAMM|nr:DUF6265 family protein [Pseudoalteromonas luteoviolacea]AOT08394.1 hypothetical protein S4054249_11295 [Pseudoalteromonas luteoviolacea]AOT13310.1 hypothetical protein S40542_11270 [Pseudoalteromonas luteoviolacea]AOT18223.1 hypothetical protein S4054_11270 [Pseudoalteromonas luteoviolacea]KKE84343.1 hypothetical protein N479_10620 [Pseudoalteromonas luteoviolacea S4054]KZN76052.1 hypothetical protein N481_06795 [Pseudoalteromonas luteoviolacea S4047-1]
MLKIIGLVILLSFAFHTQAQTTRCDSLGALSWLVGDWSSKSSKLKINESWKKISNQTYEGHGETYSIKTDRVVSAETLRLVEMSGEVFYFAKVASNELPIAFKLISCTTDTVVFENSKHDFPKKLHYQRFASNKMTVTVSGEQDKGFSIDFITE